MAEIGNSRGVMGDQVPSPGSSRSISVCFPAYNEEATIGDVLQEAHRYAPEVLTKSGFMVGLGETVEEVKLLLEDLCGHDVDVVTIGQYLQPTRKHLPVEEYVHPDIFERYKAFGEALGFRAVFAGPLVRSSYMADLVHEQAL